MHEPFPPVTINFASVKVAGAPGLSLIALVVAIAFQFPEARWLLASGVAAGALVAAVLIGVRRRQS
jgi:hypothetical protein